MTRGQVVGVFVAGVATGAALATGLDGDWMGAFTTILLTGAYVLVLYMMRVNFMLDLTAERNRAETAEQQMVTFRQMLENSEKNCGA